MAKKVPNDNNQLLQSVVAENRYTKLVAQLQKDFNLANIPIDFSLDVEPDDLRTTLHEKLYYLILERFTDYLNLLYIVDVPEKAFKEIQVTDVVEVADQVAFLILKRELQKVELKAKYSS